MADPPAGMNGAASALINISYDIDEDEAPIGAEIEL